MERKRRWIAEEELQERLDRDFQAYGAPLVMRLYKLQMIFIKKHYFGVTSEMAKALLVGWDIEWERGGGFGKGRYHVWKQLWWYGSAVDSGKNRFSSYP